MNLCSETPFWLYAVQPFWPQDLSLSQRARHDENIGYLYHLQDPRKGPLHAIRECAWNEGYFLELGGDLRSPEVDLLFMHAHLVPWPHCDKKIVASCY